MGKWAMEEPTSGGAELACREQAVASPKPVEGASRARFELTSRGQRGRPRREAAEGRAALPAKKQMVSRLAQTLASSCLVHAPFPPNHRPDHRLNHFLDHVHVCASAAACPSRENFCHPAVKDSVRSLVT